MGVGHFTRTFRERAEKALTRGDVDAAVWPRVKAAKAMGDAPNLWEFFVSSRDSQTLGQTEICDICRDSVAETMRSEGLDSGDVTVICGSCSEIGVGRVSVTCESVDERTKTLRIAEARAAREEVRGTAAPLVVIRSWDAGRVKICQGVSVGRDPACDIVVASPAVSRRHAHIVVDGDAVLYVDRSTNGSTVDGVPVLGASVPLRAGSVIGLAPGLFVEVASN